MHFSLEPSLMLGPGTYHSAGNLFGAISDSAPDRWGRVLMERMEMRQAKIENRRPRTLLESDYLLRVNDLSRQGALRFSLSHDGPFLTEYTDLHILNRFDRNGSGRIPFLSAMSMLGASDGEVRSYLDLGESIIEYGSRASEDIKDLWKRIVLNILISNVDDHLRNHGFLFDGISGWRLSPVYDLEPTPEHVKARFLSTNITEDDSTASMELAFDVAQYFGIEPNEARSLAKEVGEATKRWHVIARSLGISRQEIELMSSAFEHDELDAALKG